MLKDFKEFAVKGNVMDLAIGVIIGGAFGKIVSSLVNDMIMPIIGMLIGNVDFTNLFITLGDVDGGKFNTFLAANEAGIATINYGLFINSIIEFIIITFSIFIVIRQLAKLAKKEEVEAAAPMTKECPYCYTEIHIQSSRCPNCTSDLTIKD